MNWEWLQKHDAEVSALCAKLKATLSKIGGTEGSRTFYKIMESFFHLAESDMEMVRIVKKQIEICVGLVNGFDADRDQLIDEINDLKIRIGKLEAPIKQKAAVGRFFDTIAGKITKYASVIGGFSLIIATLGKVWGMI